jgi:hypothetical protein
MKMNEIKNRAADGPFIRSAADAVAPIEPEDFARFEGEGGLEAPVPATELIDVPLNSALRQRPCQATHQMTP